MVTKKVILYISIVSLLLLLLLLSGCISRENLKEEIWCNSTTNVSYSNGTYIVKGLTDYNNRQVCEVYIENNNGSITQYFSKGGGYMVVVYKDKSGNIIKEINVSNRSEGADNISNSDNKNKRG